MESTASDKTSGPGPLTNQAPAKTPLTKSKTKRTRSRKGCLTCKVKHLKCDETKPECRTCTDKGLKCGGYDECWRWSQKHQRNANRLEGQKNTVGDARSASTSDFPPMAIPTSTAIPTSNAPGAGDIFPMLSYGKDPEIPSSTTGQSGDLGFGLDITENPVNFDPGWDETIDLRTPRWIEVPELVGTSDSMTAAQASPAETIDIQPDGLNRTVNERRAADENRQLIFGGYPRTSSSLAKLQPGVRDLPSLLISNWFRQVCSVWSAYDSDINFFKKLAGRLWTHSEAVSSTLRGMSAALLTEQIPHMKPTALYHMKEAKNAIQAELIRSKEIASFDKFPTGLVLSLFCIGTSVCWIDARMLGLPFLEEARALLDRINRQLNNLCLEDSQLLLFFNKSLVYWDMLLAVVRDDELAREGARLDRPPEPDSFTTLEERNIHILPHPWTGISTRSAHLFAESIRLCRGFRLSIRDQQWTVKGLGFALATIKKAQAIEEKLLELEHPTMSTIADTGDQRTTGSHLLEAAEAYRLAALLQLYQTFPDLVSIRLPEEEKQSNGQVPWSQWIVPLTLRLIKTLEQIPPNSGSRMLQPVLYITAATGLRFETSTSASLNIRLGEISGLFHHLYESVDMSSYFDRFLVTESDSSHLDKLSDLALEIGNARRFIMERLNIFEYNLPPKPIAMAKSLVKAVWDAYDSEEPGSALVHWIDVMDGQDLRSLFG